MNRLNYNTYIKHINSKDTDNTIEFECEESDLSDYSDYSDYSDTNNIIVYEQDNVSLLAANYIDNAQTNHLEKTFVDIDLETNNVDGHRDDEHRDDEHRDDEHMNDDIIEEDFPIPLKERLRNIHNRQKNIICTTLKCAIL